MNSNYHIQRAVIGSLLLSACIVWADEEHIPLADVPASVMEAAVAAVEGIKITEAEVEVEDGNKVYELEGKANGVEYEIEVSEDGTVLEVEEDD